MRLKQVCLGLVLLLLGLCAVSAAEPELDAGWANPPRDAKLRAYWWWLNGNVTQEAITRDLEQMAAKGFGGALICDAGGAEQWGNARVPHGPTFFSPAWRELYRHTLHEADRLGLEMSLNIQSGWNLGGPMVKADDAPKKLVWTERIVSGAQSFAAKLEQPKARDGYYRDLFVLAYRRQVGASGKVALERVTASSAQAAYPAANLVDQNASTFWVSSGTSAGEGPTPGRPAWLQLEFRQRVTVNQLVLEPRPGYGPRTGELQVSDDGQAFQTVKPFAAGPTNALQLAFAPVTGRLFRVVFTGAYDPVSAASPRNVQMAEIRLGGPQGWVTPGPAAPHRPLRNYEEKAMIKALHFSAPDTTPLLESYPTEPGDADVRAADVLNLSGKLEPDGTLRWDVPEGSWEVLRFGCTLNDHCYVSTCSDGWQGYAIDPFDAGAFRRYWDAVVEPLIADAGPLAGKTLKYLHTDSWEVEVANWTPTLRAEFKKRRGYDPIPFLPVIAGRIVNSREESNRYLNDFRRTMGDLAIDNHYRLFREGAHRHGLLIHPESGGPHAVPIDAQQCLGFDDAPMSEFWAWSWMHRIGDENRFFVKQPAMAAHTYGHKFVLAEGFTTIGPHWQERLWDNLKPSFDHACTEGLNRLVWHAFVCSPASEGIPGQQYFAGTHLNPLVTWWDQSDAFFAYLNRTQWLLQQGLFVADAAYYYGNHVPNFAQLRKSDPAQVGAGYDYDVFTEENLLTRAQVRDGRIVLPDGMSYRVLVLPGRPAIALPVLRKIKDLVAAGATVIGAPPQTANSLTDYPRCDVEVRQLARELWGEAASQPSSGGTNANAAPVLVHHFGKGRVIVGQTAREVLLADGVRPDFEVEGSAAALDYIHRRDGQTEIYFVANRSNTTLTANCTFRVQGLAPELWNAVSGAHQFAAAHVEHDGRTTVPLTFDPCGSWFVVFREPATQHPSAARSNTPAISTVGEISGPWTVAFDPKWGGPASVAFAALEDWTRRPEPGIKYYSGTATYTKRFALPAAAQSTPGAKLYLDLGDVRELASVKLNGKPLGTVWTPPFRVDISEVVTPADNTLEVEVVNFWPNRIIGDQSLPADQRFTRTNVRKLTADTPLMPSGLLGPVTLVETKP
ncbi:MAG TPA: glycosyl hydrolase [Verrucomicrobiae bacterium]|nr:glycosyl hydrolase [Verrucomicrobiae bacterium]